jgi:hypothetical protein
MVVACLPSAQAVETLLVSDAQCAPIGMIVACLSSAQAVETLLVSDVVRFEL